jgi:hypothetical protein
MHIDDHTVSDIFGFAGVVVTQVLIYLANTRALRQQDKAIQRIEDVATNNNKGIAVVQATVENKESNGVQKNT